MKGDELRELDDLVQASMDLLARAAEHGGVREDVLASGQVHVEAGAELEERGDAAALSTRPSVGRSTLAITLSSVLFAEAVATLLPEVLGWRTFAF
jgi:hypothetical protein